jgi:hypothetical protein
VPACQRHGDVTPVWRETPRYILDLKFLGFKLAGQIL